jgi:hypothetical protein
MKSAGRTMAPALLHGHPEDLVQARWSISAAWPVVLALGVAACGQTVGGNKPVGKTEDTDAELQRYLRRTYLDLAGHPPATPSSTMRRPGCARRTTPRRRAARWWMT